MNRLKDLREEKDLLQKDIAKVLNMHPTSYSKYELETRGLSLELLKKLADFYNTSIDYLVYRTDERKPFSKSKVDTKQK